MATEIVTKKNILDMFIDGARRGFTIATTNLLPNVLMAFVIIRALDVTGLLKLFGTVFAPVMALWGLPGQAAAVLLAAFMSMGGSVGVAASLFASGTLDATHITILLPAIYLMGNPVQNVGRCLGTGEVNSRYYAPIIMICILNSLLSMWAMRAILLFF